jgi:lipopolysaccharide heptosyltransferase II
MASRHLVPLRIFLNNIAKSSFLPEGTEMSKHHQNLPGKPDIQRVLVMKWSALGDLVISTAMFSDIRRAFPNAVIDLQTLPSFAALFANDPRFNNVCAIDTRKKMGLWRWLKFVKNKRYDLVFDLQSNDRSQMFMTLWFLLGRSPRWRVGNHFRFPYNVARDSANADQHAFDLQRETLAAAGIPVVASRPQLYPNNNNQVNAANLMTSNDLAAGQFAVLVPGSQIRGLLKRWGSERYASLARVLKEKGVDKVVLVGGPDDIEECAAIKNLCSEDWLVDLCGQTQVLDLIPLCDAARMIVSNDTGPAHVASSTPTPTPMVVICGPTDPRRVKPVGENVVALQADLDCLNCYRKECSHHSCMRMITTEMVVDKLKTLHVF